MTIKKLLEFCEENEISHDYEIVTPASEGLFKKTTGILFDIANKRVILGLHRELLEIAGKESDFSS